MSAFSLLFFVFLSSEIGFCKVHIFYSDTTSVCIFRYPCLRHVGSQNYLVACQEFPNRFILFLFRCAWQLFHTCHSVSGPDLLIVSRALPFRHLWVFINGVCSYSECLFGQFLELIKKINYLLVYWVGDNFLEFGFCCYRCLSFHVLSIELFQNFSQFLSGWTVNVFESLQCIPIHERVYVVFSQLVVSLEACLEKSSNSSNFSGFPSNVSVVLTEDFGKLELRWLFLLENCKKSVVFQLLKNQQNFVCFDRRRVVFAADLRLTCRAKYRMLACRNRKGSTRWFLLELGSPCQCLHVGPSFVLSGSERRLLQGADHSGSHPLSFPDLYHLRSWLSPEWTWFIGFKKIHQVGKEHLRRGSPS